MCGRQADWNLERLRKWRREDFTRLREDEIAELLQRKVVANLKTMLVVFTVSRVNYEGRSSATE